MPRPSSLPFNNILRHQQQLLHNQDEELIILCNEHSVCPYTPLIPLKVQLGTFVGVIKCLADTEAERRMKSPHAKFTDAESR